MDKFFAGLRNKLSHYQIASNKILINYTPINLELCYLIGGYLIFAGLVINLANKFFYYLSNKFLSDWVAGLVPNIPIYNTKIVNYFVLALLSIGGANLPILFKFFPKLRSFFFLKMNKFLVYILFLPFIFFLQSATLLPPLYFIWADLILIFPLLAQFFSSSIPNTMLKKSTNFSNLKKKIFLIILLVLSVGIAAKAWYPVQISNDYFEIPDKVLIPNNSQNSINKPLTAVNRLAFLACLSEAEMHLENIHNGETEKQFLLEKIKDKIFLNLKLQHSNIKNDFFSILRKENLIGPVCNINLRDKEFLNLKNSLLDTGEWQMTLGRLFYHHSYILVPALHMLKYGVFSPIPHIYGIGNTFFHTLLLKVTSPTLTSYFNTFPIAQITGILTISLLVFYITGNFFAFLSAFSLILIFLFNLKFGFVQLAPGFSSLRATGVILQIWSIFFLFRNRNKISIIFLFITSIFSIFWNLEFALTGCIGQWLSLTSPQLKIKNTSRIFYLAFFLITLFSSLLIVNYLEKGFINNKYDVIFGFTPVWTKKIFSITIYTELIIFLLFFFFGKKFFINNEQAARFYTFSILILIMGKIFNWSSFTHIFFCLSIISPILLMFLPWRSSYLANFKYKILNSKWENFFTTLLILTCFYQSLIYFKNATYFKNQMFNPYKKNIWSEMGENFSIITDGKPIFERIKAIRSQIQPKDKIVFISPFDNLLSIYINPEFYCGHFDLRTNLISYKIIDSVINCIRNSPSSLIIYDEAIDTPFPPAWSQKYFRIEAYRGKKTWEFADKMIVKYMNKDIVLVKKIGSLSFYRPLSFFKEENLLLNKKKTE